MPATEQTWRDNKQMHVIFCVSSLLMLLATVWMLADDHSREWKATQRRFRDIESAHIRWRMTEEQTDQYVQRRRELEQQLAAARRIVPPKSLLDEFKDAVVADAQRRWKLDHPGEPAPPAEQFQDEIAGLDELRQEAAGADDDRVTSRRQGLLDELDGIVKAARLREDDLSRRMKFAKADLDVARSLLAIAVDEAASPEQLHRIQTEQVDPQLQRVAETTSAYEEANLHRMELQRLVGQMTKEEALAREALAEHESDYQQLQKSLYATSSNLGKTFLELPIVDPFKGPLKPDQIWLPDLTINNNFRDVARFDRCTTCHQAIDKTAPGSSVAPAYLHQHALNFELPTPDAAPKVKEEKSGKPLSPHELMNARLSAAYGFQLTDEPLERDAVQLSVVWPESPAARVGLRPGDVIANIGDVKLLDVDMAVRYLLGVSVAWGEPLELEVIRGLPHPFASHPRLDLYVGSFSPHKKEEMGCTICHDGQGSATSFRWASHSPNTPDEADRWAEQYGWFNNHHWIFPMTPERFIESNCLKCHHEVTELEPSERYPEPPAPKLLAGYNTVRQYGCFGCHEINGYDSPNERIGPDLRAEPNYAAAALQLLTDPQITDEERQLALRVVDHPHLAAPRQRLGELILREVAAAKAANTQPTRLTAASYALAELLAEDNPTPGEFRRVGPSLRYLASKVDETFVYNWLRDPKDFRPTTRMPQFFGLHDHLLPEPKLDDNGNVVTQTVEEDGHTHEIPVMEPSEGLLQSQRLEPVEIYAVTHFLLDQSQSFEPLDPPDGVTEEASAERGKELFETRGCLACHTHEAFPEIQQTQGPELSRMGAKLTTEAGRRWLYSWVRQPNKYHTRTVMPNVFLDAIDRGDGQVSDPAADVTAFLLDSKGWTPGAVPALDEAALDDLVLLHLTGTFARSQAERFLEEGIPESMAGNLKGDEIEMVGPMSREKKLAYVGRRTINRLGCYGCHDIPGFETAKPIGTTLADWGRKETSKLAFEQISQYVQRTHGGVDQLAAGHGGGHIEIDRLEPDTGYFMEKLLHHEREGFLWQKLREPRSYDYQKTKNKPYIERLRMPKFNFTDAQIEQVMTFVLGLVSEAPAEEYHYHADQRQRAILEGRKVLDKYNCGGCHTLELERWEFDYDPQWFADNNISLQFNDYDFLRPHFTQRQIEASQQTDYRGLGSASVHGVPVMDDEGNITTGADDDDKPVYYFTLWRPEVINGEEWVVGGPDLLIPPERITRRYQPLGGGLARYLFPRVLAKERAEVNPNVKSTDAWGWVPPPLVNEGRKVNPDWLHGFLLNPYPIRPAVVLRMPKFNMSPEEATKLVNYFAATDNVNFPYDYDPRTSSDYLASTSQERPGRLDDAMKIVTDGKVYCMKCHSLGDYTPPGTPSALAPNLDHVYERIRPVYLRDWLANPKRLLPYTTMPQNFPLGSPAPAELYDGTSGEQLEAVVDLLLNYDHYMEDKTSIKPLVQAAPPEEAAGGAN